LRLLNKPDLRLDADPDVHLDWKSGDWLVGGSVMIQQARIAPVTSFVSQVNESEDIRIIAGTLPQGGVQKAPVPFRLSGELEITLGEKV